MSGSAKPSDLHVPAHPVRFVTAAALFDGHDAAINIMRRILQAQGAEVVHLGHDRSVREVVDAVLEEDAQGVAVSSYQGGHVEYFEYLAQLLRESGAGHVRVFGGGGGVIVPEEIARLAAAGVRIFSPEDGQRLGLAGMINELIRECDVDLAAEPPPLEAVLAGDRRALARAITCLQGGPPAGRRPGRAGRRGRRPPCPVLGITGTGGSGKSSLTDELVRRLRTDQQDKLRVAVLAVDPTRRRGGGALLGDRIRMNALDGDHVFFRSLATRGARELPERIEAIIAACQAAGLRPGDPGDARHRAGRRRGRAAGGRVPVRDDAGVRRRVAAGEDRHARLRRRGGDQQVRAARRRRRAAGRVPAADPQPGRVRRPAAGHAGVRHQRGDVQRQRRHRPVPAPGRAARRPRPAAGRGRAARGHRPDLDRRGLGHPARPDRLPGGDRRDRPRLPRANGPAGRGGAAGAKARRRPG